MTHRLIHTALIPLLAGVSLVALCTNAAADVPAGYTGTPFGGTPRAIPGRIDFEDYDDGGQDVAWRVDDHTGNFGVDGCGGNDYRTDLPHPQICKTNAAEMDNYSEGPMAGMPYDPGSLYIGYTHGVDWVKLTVDVKQAGTYTLSSTWASEPGGADAIKFQISFNDVLKADVSLPGTGNGQTYHNWVEFPDFATVQLDAGVQVLQFAAKSQHLNYDYIQFSLVLPGGGVDDGSGGASAGGAGAGGAAGAAGGDSIGGAAGAGGVPAAGGMGGTLAMGGDATGLAGTGGSAVGIGGAAGSGGDGTTAALDPNAADPAAVPSTGGTTPAVDTQSGCAIAVPRGSRSVGFLAGFGLVMWAFSRRRRN